MSKENPSSSSSDRSTDELKSQNLLQNPSSEICKFTDPEIHQISSFFPTGTIFRPYDSTLLSDSASKTWVCFPACPFLLGYSYPYPDFTQRFFTLTGISYIQAMPMIWRTLLTIEEIIVDRKLDFGLSELSYLYSLVTHGSNRFLFKSKPHQPIPLFKVTQNGSSWKNQFFFVKRDSIPNGNLLSIRWIRKVDNFAQLSELPGTKKRIAVFLALSPFTRTFKIKIHGSDSEKEESTSSKSSDMSNMPKSVNKSSTKFSLDDIDCLIYPKLVKKETSKAAPTPNSHVVTTKAKSQSVKKRKLPEPEAEAQDIEKQMFDAISQGTQGLRSYYSSINKDLEDTLTGMRTLAAAKEKTLAKLTKEKKQVEYQLHAAEAKMQDGIKAATEEAKMWAAKLVLQARLKMVAEANDPSFDKSQWDVEEWKKFLAKFGGDEEGEGTAEMKKDVEAGGESLREDAKVAEQEDATPQVGDEGYHA